MSPTQSCLGQDILYRPLHFNYDGSETSNSSTQQTASKLIFNSALRCSYCTIVSKELSVVAKDRGQFMYRGSQKLDN